MSILITGGTGTFGRALTRYLIEAGLERICIYSRGEHAQAAMRSEFGATDQERIRWFIGDVRDLNRLRRAMEGCEVVVHAAALKRVEVAEYCPDEVVKTNVLGALNVIDAARDAGVQKVVALSTDKAYNPVNAYGASKLLAEKVFLSANNVFGEAAPHFAVCRYGNIWGSMGSVVPKWRDLMSKGDRIVPVTNPNCTRFFMRIADAVDLVWHTLKTMRGGELVIPDLPAYRLGDLAQAMGAVILETGLPKWEKLHESMDDTKRSNTARRLTVDELREALKHA